MKKLTYLFVMIVGMTLASVNVIAQDAKSTADPVKKEASSCCKNGGKMADGKTCTKEQAAACAKKSTGTTASTDKPACTKAKAEATTSEVKDSKKVN
jgi:hypothetical protein